MQPEDNLIWLDLETSGLNPDTCCILEVASVITDANLDIIGTINIIVSSEGISSGKYIIEDWPYEQHTHTGLLDECASDKAVALEQASKLLLEFYQSHNLPAAKVPLCGNSICFDRAFMIKYLPKVEKFYHYRNIDVSSIKELVKRWESNGYNKPFGIHRAMPDILASIEELKYYKKKYFK